MMRVSIRSTHSLSLLCFCIAALFAMTIAESELAAQPRFAKIAQFDRPIGCGFFFNEAEGFIGTGIRPLAWRGSITPCPFINIYHTTDGGATWKAMVTPPNSGAVTMITMVDSLKGYASIFSDGFKSRQALWHTIDGGQTWTDEITLSGLGTAVHATSKVLLVNDWEQSWYGGPDVPGVSLSTDKGSSWLRYFPAAANGVAFSDDRNGVLSFLGGPTGQVWYYTLDGGMSWQETSPQYEAWSIHALENSSIFICANESQVYQPHTSVNWSLDGGATWSTRYEFNNIRFTGHITGKGPTLYLQTDTAAYGDAEQPYLYGIYRSDDTGRTWHSVGGPANNRDTRAVVATGCSGEVAYAFDVSGGVYKTTQGGDGTLTGGGSPQYAKMSTSTDSLRFLTRGCRDSALVSIYSGGCAAFYLDSLVPLQGKRLSGVRLKNSLLLANGDSAEFKVYFDPVDNIPINDTLRAYAHAGSRVIIRDILVRATRDIPLALGLSQDSITLFAPDCSIVMDSINYFSLNCRTFIIDSIQYNDGELRGIALTDVSTAGGILRLGYQPDSAGTHRAQIRVFGHSDLESFDTTITVSLRSDLRRSQFSIPSDSISAATVRCEERTVSLPFRNTGCAEITIDSIRSAYRNFEAVHLLAPTLQPGSEDSLSWRFRPNAAGEYNDTIRVFAHSRGVTFDTTIILRGKNSATAARFTIPFDSLNITTAACQEQADSITLHNFSCDPLIVDSVTVAGSEFLAATKLPSTVASGDSTPISILFRPDSGGVRRGYIVLHCRNAAGKFDTVLWLEGKNSIAPELLALDKPELQLSTSYCQPTEQTLALSNQGCLAMTIDSVRIESDLLNEFSLIEPRPESVGPLDSTKIRFRFTPSERGGRDAKARIFLHNSYAKLDTIIRLSGYNQTAPEPMLGKVARCAPGGLTEVLVTLRPTEDRFQIPLVHARISMNTDLLAPLGVSLESSLCAGGVVQSFIADRTGASVTIALPLPITESSDLSLPLFRLICEGKLSRDSSTAVAIDTFSITTTAELPLCQTPTSEFVMDLLCGDPLIQSYLRTASLGMKLLAVVPNPADQRGVVIRYLLGGNSGLRADWVDAAGLTVKSSTFLGKPGLNSMKLVPPSSSGDYILRLRSDFGETTWKVVVQH